MQLFSLACCIPFMRSHSFLLWSVSCILLISDYFYSLLMVLALFVSDLIWYIFLYLCWWSISPMISSDQLSVLRHSHDLLQTFLTLFLYKYWNYKEIKVLTSVGKVDRRMWFGYFFLKYFSSYEVLAHTYCALSVPDEGNAEPRFPKQSASDARNI